MHPAGSFGDEEACPSSNDLPERPTGHEKGDVSAAFR
jgi:hypothetical protein